MREILFRAKRLDNGEWIEGYYLKCPHQYSGFLADHISVSKYDEETESSIEHIYPVDPETVCQFTGLTDKKRKKIFEGDIVSFRHRKPDFDIESEYPFFLSKEYNRNYVIEFSNTTTHYGLRFKNGSITFPCKQGTLFNGDCKVIGNIFDNPELLKEGAE